MSVDIYHSRRTKFQRVPYYTDAPNRELEKWVLTAKPKGYVYCQPVDNRNLRSNPVNNVMMFDTDSMVLLTSDECDVIKGNVVLYRGHAFMVDNVVKELHLKESQYGHDHYDTYLYIRR